MTNSLMTYLSLLLTISPIIGLTLNVLFNSNPKMGSQLAATAVGMGLILSIILLGHCYADNTTVYFLD